MARSVLDKDDLAVRREATAAAGPGSHPVKDVRLIDGGCSGDAHVMEEVGRGWAIAWLSVVSLVVYLLTSHGVRNHFRFLFDSAIKVVETLS